MNISSALKIAKEYCNKEEYDRSLRIMEYIAEMDIIPNSHIKDDCICLIFLHASVENEEFNIEEYITEYEEPSLREALLLIEDSEFEIKKNVDTYSGKLAYYAKIADIKECLCRKEFLTNELKDEYIKKLTILL